MLFRIIISHLLLSIHEASNHIQRHLKALFHIKKRFKVQLNDPACECQNVNQSCQPYIQPYITCKFTWGFTGRKARSLPMFVSVWESTEDMVTPNKRQKFKTFIERPPRSVSMFRRPGRGRVGLCCALVLTSLHPFHCRDVTVNMLQVQTGFLGSGFWQKQIIAGRKWISAL